MLAVIIPTLNAESCLPSLLPELGQVRLVISDGGSTDETLKLAVGVGAVIARGKPGRGKQLSRGADLAGAVNDVSAYLFLHADCDLLPGWREAVQTALKTKETAWYFGYLPRDKGRGVTWLRFIVWLRGWAWRLPYGDQGLLIPRDMYEELGGYDRNKDLFEDVDIIDRIKAKYGRCALRKLPLSLETDISDHLRQGVWTRGWRNYKLLKAYRRGEAVADLKKRYI
jgi:glycosyltransferase involved in cell wall biosynthesis